MKLPHLQGWLESRRAIADRYLKGLTAHPTLKLPDRGPEGHSWNQFVVRISACDENAAACGGRCSPVSTALIASFQKAVAATGSRVTCASAG